MKNKVDIFKMRNPYSNKEMMLRIIVCKLSRLSFIVAVAWAYIVFSLHQIQYLENWNWLFISFMFLVCATALFIAHLFSRSGNDYMKLTSDEKQNISKWLADNKLLDDTKNQILSYCASVNEMNRDLHYADFRVIYAWIESEKDRIAEAKLLRVVAPKVEQRRLDAVIDKSNNSEAVTLNF